MKMLLAWLCLAGLFAGSLSGCTHHIEVSAREPITINLNVKIEHEIKVKVDKELDDLFSENDELF
jgi:lipoprotein NlpI|tara:strand:+ start:2519 stop:2713 length:195 start_codon:yes stop_codon:yes gene_type:complete